MRMAPVSAVVRLNSPCASADEAACVNTPGGASTASTTPLASAFLVSSPLAQGKTSVETGGLKEKATGALTLEELAERCSPADVPEAWRALVVTDVKALEGAWSFLIGRSESADALLKALGISMMKRSVLGRGKEETLMKIDLEKLESEIVTRLALKTKAGIIRFDLMPFDTDDDDTGVTWKTIAGVVDGRLLQYRESKLGVMFDIRCVFERDPEGKIEGGPLMLFRWALLDRKGKLYVVNRWMKRMR